MRIHCPVCGNPFEDNDQVLLNNMNTVTHQECTEIKDSGTYEQIMNKYEFFRKFRNEK